MIARGTKSSAFFNHHEGMDPPYSLKSKEQYAKVCIFFRLGGACFPILLLTERMIVKETNTPVEFNKKYLKLTGNSIDELILNYPYKQTKPDDIEKEKNQRRTFIHFIKGLLTMDPAERYAPDEVSFLPPMFCNIKTNEF
jgi:hypothetical protein